jgi:hypothetical protein
MGAIIGGLVVAGAGALMSASGAKKNAASVKAAQEQNIKDENQTYKKWSGLLDTLISDKTAKLSDAGNIFDRMSSTGAFGNTNTLRNLRKAQEDFSALAAGDFSGFNTQLRKSLSDSLVNTFGSGAPIGTYAGLAADTQMQYRQQGLQNAGSITELLSNQTDKLLGQEFGIMDQSYQVGYNLDKTRQTNIANYRLGAAAQAGVGLTAMGNATQNIGASITGYGTYLNSQQRLDARDAQLAQQAADMKAGKSPLYNYQAGPLQIPNYAAAPSPSFNSFNGSFEPPPENAGPYPDIALPSGLYKGGGSPLGNAFAWQGGVATRPSMSTADGWYNGEYIGAMSVLPGTGAMAAAGTKIVSGTR